MITFPALSIVSAHGSHGVTALRLVPKHSQKGHRFSLPKLAGTSRVPMRLTVASLATGTITVSATHTTVLKTLSWECGLPTVIAVHHVKEAYKVAPELARLLFGAALLVASPKKAKIATSMPVLLLSLPLRQPVPPLTFPSLCLKSLVAMKSQLKPVATLPRCMKMPAHRVPIFTTVTCQVLLLCWVTLST